MFIKINRLLVQLESGGMNCVFGMFINKVATAMLSRKNEMEKEKRVTPHMSLFAMKLFVSQKKTSSSRL